MKRYGKSETARWTADDWRALSGKTVEIITDFSSGQLNVTEATIGKSGMVTLRNASGGSYIFSTYFGVTVIVEDNR